MILKNQADCDMASMSCLNGFAIVTHIINNAHYTIANDWKTLKNVLNSRYLTVSEKELYSPENISRFPDEVLSDIKQLLSQYEEYKGADKLKDFYTQKLSRFLRSYCDLVQYAKSDLGLYRGTYSQAAL